MTQPNYYEVLKDVKRAEANRKWATVSLETAQLFTNIDLPVKARAANDFALLYTVMAKDAEQSILDLNPNIFLLMDANERREQVWGG